MASDGDVVKGPSQREQESAKSISVQTGTLRLCYYSQTEENSRGNIGSSLNHPTGRMAHNTTDDLREGKVLKFLSDTSLRLSFCLAHRDESRGSGGGGLMSYLWHRRQVNVPYLSFFLIPISPLLLRWCIQGYKK